MKKIGTIACFVKDPRFSLPKTRLAKWCGQQNATLIYYDFLNAIQVLFMDLSILGYDCVWAMDSGGAVDSSSATPVLNSHRTINQGEGSLGKRLSYVYDSLNQESDKVLLIGADCPQLNIKDVEEAMLHLNENPFVFGEASDGGFYLFGGAKPLNLSTWTEVNYSTDSTLQDLERKIFQDSSNRSRRLSKKYTDLDEETDVTRFMGEIKDDLRCKKIYERLKNLV